MINATRRPRKQKPLKGSFRNCHRDVTSSVAHSFFSELGYPNLDIEGSLSLEFPLYSARSVSSFRRAYWAAEGFSKTPVDLGVDTKAEAINRFNAAETLCEEANHRLTDVFNRPIPEAYRKILLRARSIIGNLVSGISLDEIVNRARWGPGASTGLPRRRATAQHKWQFASHVTYDALPYLHAFARYGRLPNPRATIVGGNRIAFVHKNAKTDRTIAIEPDWNMFFQLGVGAAIRSRLQRVGLLLPDGQDRNRSLALQGSVTGRLATIDLSNASDSVSLSLCSELLPLNLWRPIVDLRSPIGELEGETIIYEKVSSMGNGCTFELETLLFYGLARAVVGSDGVVSVYGDDIIVPSVSAPLLVEILELCGFRTNPKKTFISGPFRESCGGHYFLGSDVTPPYFRHLLDRHTHTISAANRLRSLMTHQGLALDSTWKLLSQKVPRWLYGISSSGEDGCLHVPIDVACPLWDRHTFRYTGRCLRTVRAYVRAPQVGALTAALWQESGETSTWPGKAETVVIRRWFGEH